MAPCPLATGLWHRACTGRARVGSDKTLDMPGINSTALLATQSRSVLDSLLLTSWLLVMACDFNSKQSPREVSQKSRDH